MTNFERIKKMNEQELAEFIETINDCCCCPYGAKCDGEVDKKEDCVRNLKEWLKSEYVLTFRDVKVGERFKSEDNRTYIKVLECERNGSMVNAVEINNGQLARFSEDKEIMK